jgi:hypothetical protein
MRRIFTFSFFAIALTVASFNSFGQCNQTTVDFNSGTTTQGFTGEQTGGTGSFTSLALDNAQLRSTATVSAGNTAIYTIKSATYTIPAIAPINFTFAYGDGSQATATVQYSIRYKTTGGTISTTTPQSYSSGTCVSVPRPGDMLGNEFQVLAIYTVTQGGGNSSNSYIFLDNFGTNGTFQAQTLPVKFSAFEAKTASNGVALNWSVGSEINVSGYNIEKSTDGRSFTKIGFVAADGKSSYSFVDAQGAGAVAYYRIKSVDNDGKYNFSTVAVLRGGKYAIVLKAFPSPFINKLTVQHGTANAGSLIAVSSEDGRTIRSVVPVIGTQQTEIDLTTAKAGLYLVRYSNSNGQVETLKVLKQ